MEKEGLTKNKHWSKKKKKKNKTPKIQLDSLAESFWGQSPLGQGLF